MSIRSRDVAGHNVSHAADARPTLRRIAFNGRPDGGGFEVSLEEMAGHPTRVAIRAWSQHRESRININPTEFASVLFAIAEAGKKST